MGRCTQAVGAVVQWVMTARSAFLVAGTTIWRADKSCGASLSNLFAVLTLISTVGTSRVLLQRVWATESEMRWGRLRLKLGSCTIHLQLLQEQPPYCRTDCSTSRQLNASRRRSPSSAMGSRWRKPIVAACPWPILPSPAALSRASVVTPTVRQSISCQSVPDTRLLT
ncbi:hypothetical protein EJ04DRAFT_297015 [Polyplosphaeria fusca]|uniref:Uncharacterized protein n=1 Tax=Polyplosphaeria fusca TaxID=682080 RepID=A0A9P4QX14_9PLEO|nr:hypothetical protein EJ04DRAFT_297015 [Polyplosphaeria fusca]